MRISGARRWARQLHRERLDGSGEPYLEHLRRVADTIASDGASQHLLMAVWLHGTSTAGLTLADLAARGVPAEVVAILDAATRRPWEPWGRWAVRVKATPGALNLVRADWLDESRPEALERLTPGQVQHRVGMTRYTLDALGLPLPDHLVEPAARLVPGIGMLASWDPTRWDVVDGLGRLGDVRAARSLLKAYRRAMHGDPDWESGRWALGNALSGIASHQRHLANPWWVATLERLTTDIDPQLRSIALAGLRGSSTHQPLLVCALDDPDASVVLAAVAGLGSSQTDDLLAAFIRLRDVDEPLWRYVREEVILALVRIGDPRIWPEVLQTGDTLLSLNVARQLAKHGDRALGPRLVELLRQQEPAHLEGLAFVLGEWRVRQAAPALALFVQRPGMDTWLVGQIIEALGKIGDPGAAPALAALTEHEAAMIRLAALQGLAKIAPASTEDAALQAAQDFDPEVRALAIRILSQVGTRRATAALAAACDGPLAETALKGLIRIADPRAMSTARSTFLAATDRRRLHLAGRALVSCAGEEGPALYLRSTFDVQRLRATAWVIGRTGGPAAVYMLAENLSHSDGILRARCADALGRLGSAEAVRALLPALRDPVPRVRANAATAVARAGTPFAANADDLAALTAALEPGLDDPHPDVIQATRAALRRLASAAPSQPPSLDDGSV